MGFHECPIGFACWGQTIPQHVYSFEALLCPYNGSKLQNPPEFAQAGLSRSKGRLSPTRSYKFGRACSQMADHYSGVTVQIWVCLISCHFDLLINPTFVMLRFESRDWRWCNMCSTCHCGMAAGGWRLAVLPVEVPGALFGFAAWRDSLSQGLGAQQRKIFVLRVSKAVPLSTIQWVSVFFFPCLCPHI